MAMKHTKFIALLLTLLMVFSLLPMSAMAADTAAGVTVNKTAEWVSGQPGLAKVTLTVNATSGSTTEQQVNKTDIVLVMDASGSMRGNKLDNAKTAARSFVSKLLPTYANSVQIAVVPYSDSIDSSSNGYQDFTNSLSTLNGTDTSTWWGGTRHTDGAIDKIYADGGTNIQLAINKAQTLLAGQAAGDNKIMVVLTDGEPNYSYKGTTATSSDGNSYNVNSTNFPFIVSGFSYNSSTLIDTQYYSFSGNNEYTVGGYNVNNHGVGTVSEAYAAKAAGTKVYAIGYDIQNGSNADKVMSSVASTGCYYTAAASSEAINSVFTTIVTEIEKSIQPGTGATVSDPMGADVDLVTGDTTYVIAPSQGTAEPATGNRTLDWNIGTLTAGTYTLTYYVRLNNVQVGENTIKTNNGAVLTYTDNSGVQKTVDFSDPELTYTGYSVTYNWSGDVPTSVTKPSGGTYLEGQSYSVDSNYSAGQTVVTTDKTYTFSGWELNGAAVTGSQTMETANVELVGVWTSVANSHNLTVKYVGPDDGVFIAPPTHTETVNTGAGYNVASPAVTGYTADKATVSGTMGDADVEETVTYTANTDVSYTVNYLEKDTNNVLATAKTVTGKTFNSTVSEDAVAVTGYTVVAPSTQSLTLDAYNKSITFYYTVRTDLSYTINYYKDSVDAANKLGDTVTVDKQTFGTDVTLTETQLNAQKPAVGFMSGVSTPASIAIAVSGNNFNVVYTRETDTLTTSIDNKGTITPTTRYTYSDTAKTAVTFTAATGYYVNAITVDGKAIIGNALNDAISNGLTVDNTKDHSVVVTTTANSVIIPPVVIPEEPVPEAELNTTDHYAYIIGMPDGFVHPEDNITRGEVATIFFRMLTDESRTESWKTTNSYKDVPASLWCNNAISTLSNAGIIKGYLDGTFRPNAPITRAEFATMAVRFFESKYNGADKFSDIANSWARQYINAASEAGIIKGYTDGTFRPTQLITRAEAVTIMNRALLRAPDKDHLLADMKTWPDNMVLTKWYYADMQEATNSHDYTMPEDESVTYETWTKMQAVRDWAKFETEWATANASTNPGEVVTPATTSTGTSGS